MEARKIIEGKTKIVWEYFDGLVRIESKDDITAGDGERRDVIADKGRLATTTTVNCFKVLKAAGIPTHFENVHSEREFIARKVDMIPREIVVRRIATGSYLKRQPEVAEGTILPYVVEFFAKDDARHDPLIIYDFVSERTLYFDPKKPLKDGLIEERSMRAEESKALLVAVPILRKLALKSFKKLEQTWNKFNVTLVDLKIECGWVAGNPSRLIPAHIVVADVIDNDSWRIWPGGDKAQMKDKQVYRDSKNRTPAELGKIKENYAWVAEQTGKFLD
jgi:phosphoribosylaminoimidazole-succinocarboxamide synthase